MRIFFAAIAISSLLVAGCDAGTGDDGTGTADGTVADGGADTGGGADAGSTGGDAGAADAGTTKTTYASIVIYDGSKAKPAVCSGTGPGADIEAVALWRGSKLLGVGKPGTPNYAKSTAKGCADNKHGEADDIEAITGAVGTIDLKAAETGYLSLAGGSVEVQFGACTGGGDDPKACDGKGDLVKAEAGDIVEVYEIGPKYKTDFKMFKGCKCAAEGYEVDARVDKGKSGASDNVLGGSPGDTTKFTIKAPGA